MHYIVAHNSEVFHLHDPAKGIWSLCNKVPSFDHTKEYCRMYAYSDYPTPTIVETKPEGRRLCMWCREKEEQR